MESGNRFEHRHHDALRPEAFELFKKGKPPVDVAVALSVRMSVANRWLGELREETREACRATKQKLNQQK
jgi:hypothetical protein